ncbi:OmpA family protein [Xanthobacter autotrophicus]|uniref:OmpA family protein n=1 Tax=Xanthobacter autotrophicus TaxID=280 RepID=UPI0037263694
MTDMTVSFLFIIMILLAFFASQLHDDKTVPRRDFDDVVAERDALKKQVAELETKLQELKQEDPIEVYLARVATRQRELLEGLKARLTVDFPSLQVIISEEMDALRFKGDGLFKSGESLLSPDKLPIVGAIANRLNEILPCYTLGPRSAWKPDCNPVGAVIEAVQIEGHTDATGDFNANLVLSTNRADETFFAMTGRQPTLVEYRNSRNQPVLSVAGYGKMRPVVANDSAEGRATNRRIDLRIIMYTPRSVDDINRIREQLRLGLAGGLTR